jgi:hypothetical protein
MIFERMVPRIEYRKVHPNIAEMDGSVARFHLMQNDEWRMQNGKETAEAKRRQVAAATKKTKEQKDSRGNSREKAQKEIRLRTACLRRDEEGVRWFRVQFWLRPVWSPRRPIYAALRFQLVALATYLPWGYLVAAATYLRCATVLVTRHNWLRKSGRLPPSIDPLLPALGMAVAVHHSHYDDCF